MEEPPCGTLVVGIYVVRKGESNSRRCRVLTKGHPPFLIMGDAWLLLDFRDLGINDSRPRLEGDYMQGPASGITGRDSEPPECLHTS